MASRGASGSNGGRWSVPPGSAPAPEGFSAFDGLAAFLSRQGNTLLIKGYAGAGKTTLALELLAGFGRKGDGVYVSSRVSQRKLQEELPWDRFNGGRKRGKGDFADLRLGSSSTLMVEVLKVVGRKGGGPQIMVLDTWDGIAKEMDPTERLKAEKMLIAIADSTGTKTIFVSEEPERSTMDYLVDGIVEMKREERFGRVFREIEVQKLRGTLIEQHKYLYTLLDGKFTLIPPYAELPLSKGRAPAARGGGDLVSFGSPDLDGVFKGVPKGSVFTLVYDETVPYTAIRLVTLPMVVNALNTGHAVFDIPLPGTTNKEVAEAVSPFVSPEAFRDCLAIGSPGGDSDLLPPLYSVSGQEPRQTAARNYELIARVRNRSKNKSVIMVEALGPFETMYASRIDSHIEAVAARVGLIRSGGVDALVFLVQHDSPVLTRVLAMSGRYARVFARDRSVVVLGEKPSTPAYVMMHSPENPLAAKLVQIV